MMNRIDGKFSALKTDGKKALITYVMAGDPDISTTKQLVLSMEEAGADIVELGIPYSDPIAEGPVIQAASERAMKNKIRIDDVFNCVKDIRKESQVPIVLLIYFNCIFKYGNERFFENCLEAGIDGVIIPDMPFEERYAFEDVASKNNIHIITLVAPTSANRIKKLVENAKGFVYCVSSLGVTGIRDEFDANISNFLDTVKEHTSIPRAIGFGISTPQHIAQLKSYSEGLIVGSAIVKRIGDADSKQHAIEQVKEFVQELKNQF